MYPVNHFMGDMLAGCFQFVARGFVHLEMMLDAPSYLPNMGKGFGAAVGKLTTDGK